MAYNPKFATKVRFREDGFKTLSCFSTLVEVKKARGNNLIALFLEY